MTLQEDISGSEVNSFNIKMAINSLISWQCEFAVAVTDILTLLYPRSQNVRLRSPRILDDHWSKLKQLKDSLGCWNDGFVSWAQCQGSLAPPLDQAFYLLDINTLPVCQTLNDPLNATNRAT
jgi:hypothetical protein